MLEDERQDILDTIEKKREGIEKDKEKIAKLQKKEERTTNRLKRWMIAREIQHEKNSILSKKDDLKDLALNLEMTDEAIESQQRDTKLIEENERLPFPGALAEQMKLDNEPQLMPEKERILSIAAAIQPVFNSISGIFRQPKKEDAPLQPQIPAAPINAPANKEPDTVPEKKVQ